MTDLTPLGEAVIPAITHNQQPGSGLTFGHGLCSNPGHYMINVQVVSE